MDFGKGGHGGYAGPAVKPIALNMLSALGTDRVVHGSRLPVSAMGGITTWKDAAEFLLLGAGSLQVCTAVMHYGYRIIEDLCDGLSNWMDAKGTQWVVTPFWGAKHPQFQAPIENGPVTHGAVAAFKVDVVDGKAQLKPAWAGVDPYQHGQ